tara:strand:+ start:275 stop:1594 length:1320 start_codon:yes stop_codon:yes gene_type:complete
MHFFSIKDTSQKDFLNILLAILPLSFVAGNMIININVILFILISFFFFRQDVFKIKYHFIDKIVFVYFLFIVFTSLYNHFFYDLDGVEKHLANPIKSILFLKYFLLYIVLRYLIEKNLINLKLFFTFSFFASIFVCFDIFFQFFVGKDIFGFEIIGDGRKLSGPFGDELIAGGFIQRFSLFSFFVIPLFYRKYLFNRFFKYTIPLLFLIFLFGIILSGNRMPMILFVFVTFLIVLFHKQTRKFLIPFFLVFLLSIFTLYNFNSDVRTNLKNFNKQITQMKTLVINKEFNNLNNTTYLREFSSFYETWLLNRYIGGGIKNFRFYCHHRENIEKNSKFICNMHPHNYYLEILTETGLIGLIIVLIIFFSIFYQSFCKKYFFNSSLQNNNLIIPFIFLFFAEIFPLKSTGSFFTTGNSTYLFLIIGILVGLILKDNQIEKKV